MEKHYYLSLNTTESGKTLELHEMPFYFISAFSFETWIRTANKQLASAGSETRIEKLYYVGRNKIEADTMRLHLIRNLQKQKYELHV